MQEHDQTNTHAADSPVALARECLLYNIGRTSYAEALSFQHELHSRVVNRDIFGALVLLEHEPVLTMGVKTGEGNVLVPQDFLKANGIELVQTDRGGDVTYHGPGQLVGYPIVPLRELSPDLHSYLRSLEQVIIDVLAEFGLAGERNPPAGVWVGGQKICSIGIAVRKWVTYHGFALNVDPIMSHFALINPCGLQSSRMTSLAALLGDAPSMERVRELCADKFAQVFGVKLVTTRGPAC